MAKSEYPAIALTTMLSDDYPGCWDLVEYVRKGKGKDLPNWSDKCYIPISGTMAIVTARAVPDVDQQKTLLTLDATTMAAIAPWRLYKQVYTFPEETEKMLYEQSDDAGNMMLPIDVLYNLPYLCIYIEAPNLDENSHGFFVHFEHDVSERNPRMELRFLTVYQDYSAEAHVIHMLNNESVYTGMHEVVREGMYQASKLGEGAFLPVEVLDDVIKLKLHLVSKMIQLVLYICADNAEIKQDEVQKKILKRPKSIEFIKDKFREVEKLNCGETISQQIRYLSTHPNYVYYNSVDKKEDSGTPKTPHVRRGHWHHFWTGSEKEGNRKLILRWQSPLIVNKEKTESMNNILTINKLKS